MIEQNQHTIQVSEKLGEVSGISLIPADASLILVLAHGAGAGMQHFFMEDLANQLAANGIATFRYNLHYMEHGKKRPDPPAIAHKTISMVADYVHTNYPSLKIYLSGKSFGGRMSSQLMAKSPLDYVHGLIFYGFPLHAIGKDGVERAEHLSEINVPMLFLQGTKDKLARLDLIESVTADLSNTQLTILEGADHSFKVKKETLIQELVNGTIDWVKRI